MKKLLLLLASVLLLAQAAPAAAGPGAAPQGSDPVSHGVVNAVTYVHWGKSELYPILGLVGPGTEFDIYEYDKDWVMVLYDTYVRQGYGGTAHSFYGYMKRSAITCDPALEGDESAKADTGPGKRKGKKPRPKPSAGPSAPQGTGAATEAPASAQPEPTVEVVEDEEYDWIIRTPGLCNVTVPYQGSTVTYSFALMAQKAGGTGPSSDPAFNHGMHTPYAAMAAFGMVSTMQDMLEGMGVSGFLQGSGGVEITGQAAGATFFLDTGAFDPALVNFTLNLQATGLLNPKITDGQITGEYSQSVDMPLPLPVQLKKAGSGYRFILKGMKAGGGDLEFPAILEKAFADPDRWDKEAKEADRRREEAERLRKELLEKLKKQMQDEYNRQQREQNTEGSETTDPLTVEDENGEEIPLATLVPVLPTLEPVLPTLEPVDALATLAADDGPAPLAPLVPQDGEAVDSFPSRK